MQRDLSIHIGQSTNMTTTKQDLNLHRGLKDCSSIEAPCYVCLDLNRLLCATITLGSEPYRPYRIKTTLEALARSKEMGCPTCHILYTGILSFLDLSNGVAENNITKLPIEEVRIDLRSQHVVRLEIREYLGYKPPSLQAILDFHSSRGILNTGPNGLVRLPF